MAKSYVTLTLFTAIWVVSTFAVGTGIANQLGRYGLGIVGVLFWLIFLLGILYFILRVLNGIAQAFGYDHI